MAFGIDFIFFPLFYHHPLVAEEGGYLDRLVMTEFYTLQSVLLFQPVQIITIIIDSAIRKSGIQCCAMYILRNFFVRIKRFFGRTSYPLFSWQVRFYQFG